VSRSPGTRTPNPPSKSRLLYAVELTTREAPHAALAEDAGIEPARHSRADHRFRDGCLTGLGQSSRARRARGSNARRGVTPDLGLATRCHYQLGQPSMSCGCPARDRTSVSAFRARCPCQLDQRASCSAAPGGACPGTRTLYLPFTRRVLIRSSSTGMTCGCGESNPDWPGPRPGASAGWATTAGKTWLLRDSNPVARHFTPALCLLSQRAAALTTGLEPAIVSSTGSCPRHWAT
jgi:hypothetical protein